MMRLGAIGLSIILILVLGIPGFVLGFFEHPLFFLLLLLTVLGVIPMLLRRGTVVIMVLILLAVLGLPGLLLGVLANPWFFLLFLLVGFAPLALLRPRRPATTDSAGGVGPTRLPQ